MKDINDLCLKMEMNVFFSENNQGQKEKTKKRKKKSEILKQ